MTILYFTATGNCLHVAKKIGGKLYSIPQMEKNNQYMFEDESIGLVFPDYGLCVPPYINEFLHKVQFKCNYLFAVITYGFFSGGVTNHLLDIADERNIGFSYVNKLKMVENYLPGFEMQKEKKKEKKKNIDENLKKIISDITKRKLWICQDSWLSKILTQVHQKSYGYDIGIGETKKYHIEDACKECKICEQVCPMNNISIENGKPVFSNRCCSCLSCIQNCPEKAIRIDGEKSIERYRNSDIGLDEIIASNR